jgi:hypothetical protein
VQPSEPKPPPELLQDAATALGRAGRGAAVSHEAAAAVLGVELVDPPRRRLTVPRNRSRIVVPGWEVHRSDLAGSEVEVVDDLRVASGPRTVADLCRVLPTAHAVVAADSALRQGLCGVAELGLERAFGRGCDRLRRVGRLVDPRSGSVLESLLRVLLVTAGLPRPVSQYVIRDSGGAFVGRVDFCWPAARLVVEADGYAFHSDRAAYRHDRRRLNELERLGWRTLRFSWEDVVDRPEQVVALVGECLAAAA